MAAGKENSDGRKILQNLKKNDKPRVVGWGPVSAVFVTLGIFFGAQIIAGLLVVQYLLGAGNTKEAIPELVNDSVALQFFFILMVEAISIGLLWWFLRRRRISLGQIGLIKPTRSNLLYSLPAYGIYFTIILTLFVLIQQFIPGIDVNQDQQIGFDSAMGAGPLFLVFIALVILPALVEEIMVRGFLYGGLRNKFPVLASALLASAIFGAAHLQIGSGENPVWVAAIDTFILSMVLIWLREKTGNIWAGVAVHMMKNSLAFLSLFVFKIF